MSEAMRLLGERIYEESLGDRRGFRSDQTGVPDELWPEIYEEIGRAAIRYCAPQWQPIETAPKDGRAILGWADDVITTVYWHSSLRDWELCECGAFATDGAFSPEFWMPVPQDPTPEDSHD